MSMENGKVKRVYKVGSRTSKLAMTQTKIILEKLASKNSNIEFKLITMDTIGDKLLNTKLYNIGDSSLFTKELELALLAGEVDFVVHSLKDIPTTISNKFVIASVSNRVSCDDAVVMKMDSRYTSLASLPENSVIGTSSIRRIAQLRKKYPHLQFASIRGNLNTRLLKLDDPETAMKNGKGDGQVYEAIILAKAGLERLEWDHRISEVLSYDDTLYSVGQGALGCECKVDDIETQKLLATINDEDSCLTSLAERSFLKELQGGCTSPIGVRSELKNNKLTLKGSVLNVKGSEIVEGEMSCLIPETDVTISKHVMNGKSSYNSTGVQIFNMDSLSESKMVACSHLGESLAKDLLQRGADKILNEIKLNRLKPISNGI